jgi:hypothetical protein
LQAAQYTKESRSLLFRSRPESLGNALGWSTEIAHAAWNGAVRRVPKVTDQRCHAALIALRKAHHLIDLLSFLLALLDVGSPPYLFALTHIVGKGFCRDKEVRAKRGLM